MNINFWKTYNNDHNYHRSHWLTTVIPMTFSWFVFTGDPILTLWFLYGGVVSDPIRYYIDVYKKNIIYKRNVVNFNSVIWSIITACILVKLATLFLYYIGLY